MRSLENTVGICLFKMFQSTDVVVSDVFDRFPIVRLKTKEKQLR